MKVINMLIKTCSRILIFVSLCYVCASLAPIRLPHRVTPEIEMPRVPQHPETRRLTVQHGDPFSNLDLDYESPDLMTADVIDAHGYPVTVSSLIPKGGLVHLHDKHGHKFVEPFTVKVQTRMYGAHEPIENVKTGDVVSVWHGPHVAKQGHAYHTVCMNQNGQCSLEVKDPDLNRLVKTARVRRVPRR